MSQRNRPGKDERQLRDAVCEAVRRSDLAAAKAAVEKLDARREQSTQQPTGQRDVNNRW